LRKGLSAPFRTLHAHPRSSMLVDQHKNRRAIGVENFRRATFEGGKVYTSRRGRQGRRRRSARQATPREYAVRRPPPKGGHLLRGLSARFSEISGCWMPIEALRRRSFRWLRRGGQSRGIGWTRARAGRRLNVPGVRFSCFRTSSVCT